MQSFGVSIYVRVRCYKLRESFGLKKKWIELLPSLIQTKQKLEIVS